MFPPASISPAIRGLQAAQSAAAMRGMQSPVNMNSLDDVYSVDPHASAAAMLSSDANAGRATNALINLGGGPGRFNLVNALDDARLAHANDQTDELADLNSGVPQAIAGKRLDEQNHLADVASEASFGRQMLPNASEINARDTAGRMQDLYTRYVQPELVKGQNELTTQGLKNKGALDVEHTKADALMGLINAYAKSGQTDPDTLKSLLQIASRAQNPGAMQ